MIYESTGFKLKFSQMKKKKERTVKHLHCSGNKIGKERWKKQSNNGGLSLRVQGLGGRVDTVG